MSSDVNNLENLKRLRLSDAREQYQRLRDDSVSGSLSFAERLDIMLSAEIAGRTNRRIARRIKESGLRAVAYREEFSFETERGITRSQLANLLSLSWVASHHSVVVSGATGVGKTFRVSVVATEAARAEMTVRYHRTSDLIEKLALSRADGTHRSVVGLYRKIDLLVLDDFGLSPIPISGSRELLEILDDRADQASTVIASQFPPESFHLLMEDKTAGDAIIDRVIHGALSITLTGESMRKLRAQRPTL